MDSPVPTPFDHTSGGLSATNSTASSPPDPPTPPADMYPHQHGNSLQDYRDYTLHHHQHQYHPHHQHLRQPMISDHGPGGGSDSTIGQLPPSPGYPLHPIESAPSHTHSLNSSAANTPPKDHYPSLPSYPNHASAGTGDYGSDGSFGQHAPIDIPRQGSFSSISVSSYGAAASTGEYEYDEGPPPLEKAPPEIAGSFWHQTHIQPPLNAPHPHPNPPPAPPPMEQRHLARRGSFLDELYSMNPLHDDPSPSSALSTSQRGDQYHPHQQQQQHGSPLGGQGPLSTYPAAPSPELAPIQASSRPGAQGDDGSLPGIRNPRFAGWSPSSISPPLNGQQTPPSPAAFNSQNIPSTTMPSSLFHPPFMRRYTSPMLQRSDDGGRGLAMVSEHHQHQQDGGSPSFLNGGEMEDGDVENGAMHQQENGGNNGGFGSFRSMQQQQQYSESLNDRLGHHPVHSLSRHPSLPHLSSGRDSIFQHQSSPSHPLFPPSSNLADSRFMHRSNSLPTSNVADLPLYLQPPSHPSRHRAHQPQQPVRFQPSQYDSAPSVRSPPAWAAAPPTGPIIHTDDAASKETASLRRKCFNCSTTEPPSWRRSTLTPGKIVCNRCGLYERTHLRPRPSGSGGELRKTPGRPMPAGMGSSTGMPYPVMAMHPKSGGQARPSKKHQQPQHREIQSPLPSPCYDESDTKGLAMPQLQNSQLYQPQDMQPRSTAPVQSAQ